MDIRIHFEKRHLYVFGILTAVLISGWLVNAFGTSNPAVFGHSAGELIVDSSSIVDSSINVSKVNTSQIQARVTGTCAGNNFVQSVGSGGTVGCGAGPSTGLSGCTRQIGVGSGSGSSRTATCSSGVVIFAACYPPSNASAVLNGIHYPSTTTVDFVWIGDPGSGVICDAICCTSGLV